MSRKLIATYEMKAVAPTSWTDRGIEVINAIHWTGADRMLACAMERHRIGDVAIFDPISGEFLLHLPQRADRLYVADVLGDWREEIIVWNQDHLHIYQNTAPNPNPDRARLWEQPHYRRNKMTWNYYSP